MEEWTQAEIDAAADVAWDTLTVDSQRFMGQWGYRHFARALIHALLIPESDRYRAVGYITADGKMREGCPGLQEPNGWKPLLIAETQR